MLPHFDQDDVNLDWTFLVRKKSPLSGISCVENLIQAAINIIFSRIFMHLPFVWRGLLFGKMLLYIVKYQSNNAIVLLTIEATMVIMSLDDPLFCWISSCQFGDSEEAAILLFLAPVYNEVLHALYWQFSPISTCLAEI